MTIKLDDLTLGQIKTLVAQFGPVPPVSSMPECAGERSVGWRILVLDRGFVHVGNVTDCGDHYRVIDGRNIRIWGTTKGLGELAAGPLSNTKHDALPTADVPKRAVLFLLHTDGAKWTR